MTPSVSFEIRKHPFPSVLSSLLDTIKVHVHPFSGGSFTRTHEYTEDSKGLSRLRPILCFFHHLKELARTQELSIGVPGTLACTMLLKTVRMNTTAEEGEGFRFSLVKQQDALIVPTRGLF